MSTRRSAAHTAKLLLINAKLYEREREREITRYKFSLQTLRKVSGRKAIRQSFLDDLDVELEELDWKLLPLTNEFSVMDLSKTDSWVKLSSKRLTDGGQLDLSFDEVDDLFGTLFPPEEEPPEE